MSLLRLSAIFGMQGGGIAVFHIEDNGDVAPRYRIPVRDVLGLADTLSVALDPVHKEVIVIEMRNNILTFSFPELF
jgi:hypothetical protein